MKARHFAAERENALAILHHCGINPKQSFDTVGKAQRKRLEECMRFPKFQPNKDSNKPPVLQFFDKLHRVLNKTQGAL